MSRNVAFALANINSINSHALLQRVERTGSVGLFIFVYAVFLRYVDRAKSYCVSHIASYCVILLYSVDVRCVYRQRRHAMASYRMIPDR